MARPRFPVKAPNEIVPFKDMVYPLFGSTKFDGFRLLNLCGEQFLSPSLKPFANQNLWNRFSVLNALAFSGRWVFDGELWSPTVPFNELSGILRSRSKPLPFDLSYYVFDLLPEYDWDNIAPKFSDRLNYQLSWFSQYQPDHIIRVMQVWVNSPDEAEQYTVDAWSRGEEGMMFRSPNECYKHDRYTILEAGMYKQKQYLTEDAIIIGYEIQDKLRDGIPREYDTQGRLKRMYSQDAFEPDTKIGAFWVDWKGTKFKVKAGRGFTDSDKSKWYINRDHLVGVPIEFTYMPHGTKDAPRIGSLKRFRYDKL